MQKHVELAQEWASLASQQLMGISSTVGRALGEQRARPSSFVRGLFGSEEEDSKFSLQWGISVRAELSDVIDALQVCSVHPLHCVVVQ